MAYINFNPSDHHNIVTWAGNNTARTISGVGFQPDFLWIKSTDGDGYNGNIWDAVRTVGADKEQIVDNNQNEGGGNSATYGYVSALTSDGFSVAGGSTNHDYVNKTGLNYVAWNWKANGAGSANTDGTTNSTVSANTTTGSFSIVTYQGTGSAATIGHGLGAGNIPKFIIIKDRTQSGTDWSIYHDQTSASPATNRKYFNLTSAVATDTGFFNSIEPTDTTFSVGTQDLVNKNGNDFVAYVFCNKKGMQKFGKYSGNNSLDGTYIDLGFSPKLLIIKNLSSADSWFMYDKTRMPINYQRRTLKVDSNGNEQTGTTNENLDLLSNGFKMRYNTGGTNDATDYLYMAWAEFPMVSSNGVPATAR